MTLAEQIRQPTLLLDSNKAQHHIARLVHKAQTSGVRFRPHFKTHQSAVIGDWFRQRGVQAITVSSVDMARYFADNGWTDITIAFPVNVRQLPEIDALAQRVRLGLLVESVETAVTLHQHLTHDVHIWLKIDTGYQRTGIHWQDVELATAVAQAVTAAPQLHLTGLLAHSGHTYGVTGETAVQAIYHETVARLQTMQAALRQHGWQVALSIGDTPGASLVDNFRDVDEIRPGNFVFYDVMQAQIGACALEDIAVALACPVVAKHPARQQIVLYGGAVHLSKETLRGDDGVNYGRIARLTHSDWEILPYKVVSLSQEHGIVQGDEALLRETAVGDLLLVLPIHSCLTANLMKRYLTLNGEWIEMCSAC